MPTDTELVKGALQGIVASTITPNVVGANPNTANVNAALEVQKQRRRIEYISKFAVDASAATLTPEVMGFCATSAACRVYAVFITASALVVADNTNNANFIVSAKPVGGGVSVPVATLTTTVATGNLVADARKAFVLTAANVSLLEGQEFTLTINKNGVGIVIPPSFIQIYLEDI